LKGDPGSEYLDCPEKRHPRAQVDREMAIVQQLVFLARKNAYESTLQKTETNKASLIRYWAPMFTVKCKLSLAVQDRILAFAAELAFVPTTSQVEARMVAASSEVGVLHEQYNHKWYHRAHPKAWYAKLLGSLWWSRQTAEPFARTH